MSVVQQFRAKYLGKVGATAPKVGTLENAARIFQKGCLDINQKEKLLISVNSKCIAIKNSEDLVYVFPIKSTLFCATYQKIPQVVAFNFLSSHDPPTIECHAIYMESSLEAQNFVQAITKAFNFAYSKSAYEVDSDSNEDDSDDSEGSLPTKRYEGLASDYYRKNTFMDKLNEVFGGFTRKKVY